MNRGRVSIIGLGKLGLSMAVAFAKRGFSVNGMDVNPDTVRKVQQGISPVDETDVQALLAKHGDRIRATETVADAVRGTNLTCIVVATPSGPDGSFSNAQLLPAAEQVGLALREKRGYHVVAITCTVMPGTTDEVVRPLLERASGKKCGRDFGLVYNPEFIALGSVVRDFLNPDFVLVGESDPKAGRVMERLYGRLCENSPQVARMKCVEAEIAKIALNCFCTMKISYANMLAEVAEKVPGADARVITDAIGLDRRIGRRYLAPGLGFGGPCFPRDNVAFRAFAKRKGVSVPIPEAVHETNRRQVRRVLETVKHLLPKGGRVAILGLPYKPHTSVLTESQALEIAHGLSRCKTFSVAVYDPMALDNARKLLGRRVAYADSALECLQGAELCIIATPWPEFARLTARQLQEQMKRPCVLDCWRCLNPREATRVDYHAVGLGNVL